MIFAAELFHTDTVSESGKPFIRNAFRAVIYDHDKLLMVYSAVNREYKFPGGGKEFDETPAETILREVREEVGYTVKTVKEQIGTVTEYNTCQDTNYDFFKMISAYYLVEVCPDVQKQKLDDYEEKLHFEPKWVSIKEAYEYNKKTMAENPDVSSWIQRETYVLEQLDKNRSKL